MAEKLERLVVDREQARQMGARGRERAMRDFSMRAMADAHESLYRGLMEAAGGPARP
jgi:glycosyltransferase involved in cell wall biosynthesis